MSQMPSPYTLLRTCNTALRWWPSRDVLFIVEKSPLKNACSFSSCPRDLNTLSSDLAQLQGEQPDAASQDTAAFALALLLLSRLIRPHTPDE
jgi:hypothetical protein